MTIREIMDKVCVITGVAESEIYGRSRRRHICEARYLFIGACRRIFPPITLEEIGRRIGRHYATVIEAIKEHNGLMASAKDYREKFEALFASETRQISAFALFKPNGEMWGWFSETEWAIDDANIKKDTGWTCRPVIMQIPI